MCNDTGTVNEQRHDGKRNDRGAKKIALGLRPRMKLGELVDQNRQASKV